MSCNEVDALTHEYTHIVTMEHDFADEEPTDMTGCRLIYVDNNSIPELWMDYGYGYAGAEVYTQSDDGTDSISISQGSAEWIENENLLLASGGHMDVYYDEVYKIDSGKFVLIGAGDYGATDNSNVQYDEENNPIYDYYWNDGDFGKRTNKGGTTFICEWNN